MRPMTGRPRDPSMTLPSMVLDMDTLETWRVGLRLHWNKEFIALCHSVMAPPVCRSHVSLSRLLFCCCVLCPGQPPNEKLLIIDTVSPMVEPLSKQFQGFSGAKYRHERQKE